MPTEVRSLNEECGIFGVWGHNEASHVTYFGLHNLQHRGQEGAGIVSNEEGYLRGYRGLGLLSEVFADEKKINKWWKEYSTKTKGSPRALASYYSKSDDGDKIAKRKEEFFKNNTEHRFGTVFCRLTANYIKSQGGEFY